MNQHLLEKLQVASGFVPVDLAGGANDGGWVSLKNYGRCAIVLFKAAGTAGENPVLTLEQATDVTGTGAKALDFERIDVKQGMLSALGAFTKLANSGNSYTEATSAEAEAIWVVDVLAEDLDIDNGFDCLRASVADVGIAAQLGALLYLLHEPRYASDPLPSAIVD